MAGTKHTNQSFSPGQETVNGQPTWKVHNHEPALGDLLEGEARPVRPIPTRDQFGVLRPGESAANGASRWGRERE